MAAPVPAARTAPTGIKLRSGFKSVVCFSLDPDFSVWEIETTPPGLEGGDPIDQTTMFNDDVLTKAPQGSEDSPLVDVEEASMTVAYDPDAYNQALAMINKRQTITQHFPDGSSLAYFGYLQSFKPGALSRTTRPEAEMVVVPTNYDHVNNVEAKPVLTSVAGT